MPEMSFKRFRVLVSISYRVIITDADFLDFTVDVCKNSAIQHLKHKVLTKFCVFICKLMRLQSGVVYRSQWGLGYYLSEPAQEGDLITGILPPQPLYQIINSS